MTVRTATVRTATVRTATVRTATVRTATVRTATVRTATVRTATVRTASRAAGLGAALAVVLALGGCGEDDPPERHEPFEPTFIPIAGGVGWIAPEPLVYRQPSNPMRTAEYILPDHPDAVLAVSYFPPREGGGGDVRRNVSRWVGQLQRPPGERPEIQERTINGLPVTTLDVRGTFVGRLGTGNNNPPRVGWRILGAIAEGERGLVFFKFIGPEAALAEALPAFEELVESIHPE